MVVQYLLLVSFGRAELFANAICRFAKMGARGSGFESGSSDRFVRKYRYTGSIADPVDNDGN